MSPPPPCRLPDNFICKEGPAADASPAHQVGLDGDGWCWCVTRSWEADLGSDGKLGFADFEDMIAKAPDFLRCGSKGLAWVGAEASWELQPGDPKSSGAAGPVQPRRQVRLQAQLPSVCAW